MVVVTDNVLCDLFDSGCVRSFPRLAPECPVCALLRSSLASSSSYPALCHFVQSVQRTRSDGTIDGGWLGHAVACDGLKALPAVSWVV